MWLTVGILAERSMNDLTGSDLPDLAVPLRIMVILLAPFLFLVFERHLFYKRKLSLGLAEVDGELKQGE
jgi:hypothetical protein